MDTNVLKLIKEAKHVYVYGAGTKGKNILPVCEAYRLPEDIDVVVTDNTNVKDIDRYIVKNVSAVKFEEGDAVIVALPENYWKGISEMFCDKCIAGIAFLKEKDIASLRRTALVDSLKRLGVDPRLLPASARVDIYGNSEFHTAGSIEKRMWERATDEAAEYVIEHMDKARRFFTVAEYHDWLMTQVSRSDESAEYICMEFGVNYGYSLNRFADMCDNVFYGFDSFEGLPEDWTEDFKKSAFKQEHLPKVLDNVRLVQGWFDESLPVFVSEHDLDAEKIAFIHIDCDLYSSTKTVFEYLGKYIRKGTIIAFDEYFNYPYWKKHEFKAFQEWVELNDIAYEYMAYVDNNAQVAVRIL